ncbi:hypothetical protein D7V91_09585 [bacterium 1xD42-67]|nr:hypothetical protein D7V91_09585 [bacterium 1xD42-67]
MDDFIHDLYHMLTEGIQVPTGDPEHERAVQAYMELEAQVKEKIGWELLSQYQRAQHIAYGWEDTAVFSCGLRFGARFILEILRG